MSYTPTSKTPFVGGPAGKLAGVQGNNFARPWSDIDSSAGPHRGPAVAHSAPENGDWVATMYAKEVLLEFKTASVVESITNNDYYGEISDYGDSVIIIKEPHVDLVDYGRGVKMESQALDMDSMQIVLDQAKAFQFQVDDIESKIATHNWQSLASNAAAYTLKNEYDKAILKFMVENVPHGNIVASKTGNAALANADTYAKVTTALKATGLNVLVINESPTAAQKTAGSHMTPMNLLNKFNLKLDLHEVPEESRWVVVDPEFLEIAMREDSNVLNRDFNDGKASLNGAIPNLSGVRGLQMYKTNNTPKIMDTIMKGTSWTAKALQDEGRCILAGHMTAVATVSAIVKTETFRSQQTFADIVRGLHVYGRAVIRPESLCMGLVTYQDQAS